MTLTKIKALEETKEQWAFYAQNPGATKKDYPKLKKDMLDFTTINACYLCEYNRTHKRFYCLSNCLLANIWPDGCLDTPNNPYLRWFFSTDPKKRSAAAWEIVRGCEDAIDKLKRKKSKKKKSYIP